MKNKLNLKELKVESFVTALDGASNQTVQGGLRPSIPVGISLPEEVTDSACWDSSQIGATCNVTGPVSRH